MVVELDPASKDQVVVVVGERVDFSDDLLEGLIDFFVLGFRELEDRVVQDLLLDELVEEADTLCVHLMLFDQLCDVED